MQDGPTNKEATKIRHQIDNIHLNMMAPPQNALSIYSVKEMKFLSSWILILEDLQDSFFSEF